METLLGVIGPALGVALNPFPIIAVILVLASPDAQRKGSALLVGWIFGVLGMVGVLVLIANLGGLGPNEASTPQWLSILKLAIGMGLVVLAVWKWMGRPRAGEEAKLPGWLASLPERSPGQLARFGAILAGLNPKNLMFNLVAAASIASSGASAVGEIGLWVVYVVAASFMLLLPVGAYVLAPAWTSVRLEVVRKWLVQHNSVILAGVLVVIGAVLVTGAVAELC